MLQYHQECFSSAVWHGHHSAGRQSGISYDYGRRSDQQERIRHVIHLNSSDCFSCWLKLIDHALFREQYYHCPVDRLSNILRFGSGCWCQVPQVASQTVFHFKNISTGIVIITLFFQSLGGSIFVSVGNSILNDKLTRRIASIELPGVDVFQFFQAGVTVSQSRASEIAGCCGGCVQASSHKRSRSG